MESAIWRNLISRMSLFKLNGLILLDAISFPNCILLQTFSIDESVEGEKFRIATKDNDILN